MIEFGKVEQHIRSRRERLLNEAVIRRMREPGSTHKIRLPPRLAFAMGDWLIRIGTRLKAPYQPVNFPIPTSERGKS